MLLEVEKLSKQFEKRGGLFGRVQARVHALNGVSFQIARGETLGVVGESGCGKSTLGRTLLRLLEPTSGVVRFDGVNVTTARPATLRGLRRRMQIIFQDPHSSLNPRMTAGAAVEEVVRLHRTVPRAARGSYVESLIRDVGLRGDDLQKYPHEFSGGQKQRVGIARALAVQPEFIVADEPVSALDVSVQAQVLNLLLDLKQEHQLTLLFISHDLKVVDFFCDRILVMYLGHVVEELPGGRANAAAHANPLHPYTRALLAANPLPDPARRTALEVLAGDVPSPFAQPTGCPFVGRCPLREARCETEMPPLIARREAAHRVACWAVPNES